MERKLIKEKRFFGLNEKLNAMIIAIMIPFIALVIYLLISMINYSNAYNQSVKNISASNSYYIGFKKEIDNGVYLIVIGSATFDNIKEKQDVHNPYEYLDEVRGVFRELAKTSQAPGNARRINRIIKSFDTLEKRIAEIEKDLDVSGYYEKNFERLENNVFILTEVIQEAIQEYCYYETAYLETVRQDLEEKERGAVQISIICLILVVAAALFIGLMIARGVSEPIAKMRKTMQDVASGNFGVRVDVKSSDETAILADSFNRMIVQMGELVEGIKQEQLNLRDMELKLLQAQINPHFLYNTLDTIMWLAEAGKKEQVVLMVGSLSDFFRTTLSKGQDFVTVREEVSHIKSYLEIQQFRYHDIMDYQVSVPEEMFSYPILKLTLQPLVENALYHGIKNKRGKGLIKVTGQLRDKEMIFKVEDNGIGMKEDELSRLRNTLKGTTGRDKASEGFGVVNVAERIRLNYGKDFGLEYDSRYGIGTEVTVIIPSMNTVRQLTCLYS